MNGQGDADNSGTNYPNRPSSYGNNQGE
jgi:hypothetical protein